MSATDPGAPTPPRFPLAGPGRGETQCGTDRQAARTTPLHWLFTTILAAGLTLAIHGRWLRYDAVPETPAQDLAKHVAMALNFSSAVDDGQWLPRLQVHHATVPDIPLFQYYGFMTGLSALPFLQAGLIGIQAMAASLVLVRLFGLLALFAAARRLGLGLPAAWLVIALFTFEPYVISTLYGRVAIAEFHAQSLLPVLLLGYVQLLTGRRRIGFVTTVGACVLLALAHNIFFLYGSAFFAFLVAITAVPLRTRFIGALFLGTAILVAAFQWLPAFLSTTDLNVNGRIFYTDPHYNGYLTDARGLFGLYLPLSEHDHDVRCFFTYSWWTVPGLIGALFWLPLRKARFPLFIAGGLTLVVSLGLIDIWSFLPRFTYALQFPYRLIPFVALVGCLGVGSLCTRFGRAWMLLLVAGLAGATALPILCAPPFNRFLPAPDARLITEFASGDYMAGDRSKLNPAGSIVASDLWLSHDNTIHGNGKHPITVNFGCRSIFSDRTVRLQLVSLDIPGLALSEAVEIGPGAAIKTVILTTDRPARRIRLASSETLIPAVLDHNPAGDRRRLSVYIDSLEIDHQPVVGIAKTRLITRSGLRRTFQAPPPSSPHASGGPADYLVLPTAYTRFLRVTQGGTVLSLTTAADGSAMVQTVSSAPIESSYEMPRSAVFVSLLGLAVFLVGAVLIKDTRSA